MRIILAVILALMIYSCGSSAPKKSYNTYYTDYEATYKSLAKKYSDEDLCKRDRNVQSINDTSDYAKSLTTEIKRRRSSEIRSTRTS